MESKSGNWDNLLLLVLFIICFGYIAAVTFGVKLVKDITLASTGMDLAKTVILILVGYRWGSSRGSSKKDETIGSLLNPTESRTAHTATTTISTIVDEKPEDKV